MKTYSGTVTESWLCFKSTDITVQASSEKAAEKKIIKAWENDDFELEVETTCDSPLAPDHLNGTKYRQCLELISEIAFKAGNLLIVEEIKTCFKHAVENDIEVFDLIEI